MGETGWALKYDKEQAIRENSIQLNATPKLFVMAALLRETGESDF